MTEVSETTDDRQKVWSLIKEIKIALMVTTGDAGRLRGRPMAALNTVFDGTLWFATREGAPKVDEIAGHTQVLLAYSEPKTQDYVSISGAASLVRDRAQVEALWSEALRVWFPHGPNDPSITLIKVEVESAEYWDAPSSAWVYALGYAKARLTGESPKGVGSNKVVDF